MDVDLTDEGQRIQDNLAMHDSRCHIAQTLIRTTREASKLAERVGHLEVESLSKNSLRLFDRNSTVESLLQLPTHVLRARHGLMLQDRDRRDIGECLTDLEILIAKFHRGDHEDIQRPNNDITEPKRKCAHSSISRGPRLGREEWPSLVGSKIMDGNRGASRVALEARPFVILQLEKLEQTCLLRRGGDELQVSSLISEQDASRAGLEQLDASIAEQRQKLNEVEIIDEGVGELHEGLRKQ